MVNLEEEHSPHEAPWPGLLHTELQQQHGFAILMASQRHIEVIGFATIYGFTKTH
jgi:hypothetical protein